MDVEGLGAVDAALFKPLTSVVAGAKYAQSVYGRYEIPCAASDVGIYISTVGSGQVHSFGLFFSIPGRHKKKNKWPRSCSGLHPRRRWR